MHMIKSNNIMEIKTILTASGAVKEGYQSPTARVVILENRGCVCTQVSDPWSENTEEDW